MCRAKWNQSPDNKQREGGITITEGVRVEHEKKKKLVRMPQRATFHVECSVMTLAT